jgi:hypothetical protein
MDLNFSTAAFPGALVRVAELGYLVQCVRQGWCCSLVGPSNTGKSFLLRSLPLEEVRLRCAREGEPPPVMVFVDCLEAGNSEQAFYELLLRRIIEELQAAEVSPAAIDTLRAWHQEVLHSTLDVAFRSLYASSIRTLSHEIDRPIVLLLDEFYDVLRSLPPWPFRQLRALYDSQDTKICYITATSHYLEQLRPSADTYEFRELFQLHTLVLQPLPPEEVRRFVAYLAGKLGIILDEPQTARLIELSGGHPGLLERIYGLVSTSNVELTGSLNVTVAHLLRQRPIQKECERLWSELEAEQEALLALAEDSQHPLTPAQHQALERKGLVIKDNEGLMIFSPVFKAFIQTQISGQPQEGAKGLYCDFQTGQIWVDDQEVTLRLSEPQRKLVAFLYQRSGVVCSYDEIAEGVWGVGEGVSPGAIYELVKRVRQKVEPDWRSPSYIITVPGKGYRLETLA